MRSALGSYRRSGQADAHIDFITARLAEAEQCLPQARTNAAGWLAAGAKGAGERPPGAAGAGSRSAIALPSSPPCVKPGIKGGRRNENLLHAILPHRDGVTRID